MTEPPANGKPTGASPWGTLTGIAAIAALEACGPAGPRGAGSSGMEGKWTGTVGAGSDSAPIQFQLTDDGGTLGGDGHIGDPETGKFTVLIGPVAGTLDAGQAKWDVPPGLTISGKVNGDSFVGTLKFPLQEGAAAPLVAPLTLKR
jgi:hypothetical protein